MWHLQKILDLIIIPPLGAPQMPSDKLSPVKQVLLEEKVPWNQANIAFSPPQHGLLQRQVC